MVINGISDSFPALSVEENSLIYCLRADSLLFPLLHAEKGRRVQQRK